MRRHLSPVTLMLSRSLALGTAVIAIGCAPAASTPSTPSPTPAGAAAAAVTPMAHATAAIHDLSGHHVGDATFTDSYAGVIVTGTLNGLGLGGHAIHIHEFGKCEAPFASAGGHFNPDHRQHGFSNPRGPHLGDLPNVYTPAAGTLKFEFVMPGVTLEGQNRLLDADGAAIVVHESHDDYTTDPSGNSGGRIACGVITR